MDKSVRSLLVVLSALLLAASAKAQLEFEVPQVEVEARVVVVNSSNLSAGGARWGPSFAAKPGDQLTTQLFLNPGMHGISGYAISCQFDADLRDELDFVSLQNLNGSTGPASPVQESDSGQKGIIETIGGSFNPPLPAFDIDTPIAEIVFDVRVPFDDGPDIECGLFAAPIDFLQDAAGGALDPNDLDFPGTILNEQRQHWAPTFAAPLPAYQFNLDIGPGPRSVSLKTGTICKNDCPDKERGIVMKAGKPDGSSLPQAFVQPPIQVTGLAVTMTNRVHLDVSGLEAPGSFVGYEIDTPFVLVGGNFNNFVFFSVVREANGDLSLFSDEVINGGPSTPIATPMPIPGDTETVVLDISWANDELNMMAGAMNGIFTDTVTAHPLLFNGSAGFGLGMRGAEKGETLGATIEISGEIATGSKMALDDLKAVLELEQNAIKDLDSAGLDVKKMEAAKKKLQRAIEKLKLGDKIPGTKPPQYENPLINKAYVEVESLAGKSVGMDVKKRLEKAAKRDQMAIKRIDKAIKRITDGKSTTKVPKDLATAKKFIGKANDEKVKTKAVMETLAKKDSKGV